MSTATARRVSIAAPEFTYFPDTPEGFRSGVARLGKPAGAEATGLIVY